MSDDEERPTAAYQDSVLSQRASSALESNPGKELGLFDAKYLGSVSVRAPEGNDVCADALLRIRALDQPERKVKLVVTSKAVFIRDTKTKEIIKSAVIPHISFVTMDALDKKLFSYITHEPQVDMMMCHAFQVKSKADRIPIALNEAFMLNSGKVKRGLRRRSSKKQALNEATSEKRRGRRQSITSSLGTFSAKYLGSVAVQEAKGNEVALDALDRIKALKQEARPVDIVVTPREVEVVVARSFEVIKSIPILEISFSAVHPKDSKLIMWITNDARLDLMYCHAFQVKKVKGEAVLKTMAQAFVSARQRLEASQGDQDALREMGVSASRKTQSNALGVFEAKFIGSVPAIEVSGSEVAEKAIVDAKHLNRHPEGVIVIISSEGIRTIEGLTGEVLTSVLITDVSFVTTSGAKRDVLAFISKDTRLKRITCHVFECRRAKEISTTIGKAFAKAKEEQEQRAGNPFAPTTSEREPVQGPLFKYQIHRRDLVAEKPIGAGQFGQVFRATFKHKKVAVKTVRQTASAQDKDEFMDEAVVMVELSHANLVGILGVSLQQKPWLCVIEYMDYGDLRDVLQTCEEKGFQLREAEQLHFARQIASGLAFMASLRYIHMDIAARNCLLTHDNIVKVADFGLTRKLDEGKDTYTLRKSAKLPVRWMAVETMTKKLFSEASDVWSFGVLLWEIMSYGELPYKQVKNKNVQKAVVEGLRPTKPETAPDALFRVAETCWRTDRLKRYKFAELKEQLNTLHQEASGRYADVRDIGATISSM